MKIPGHANSGWRLLIALAGLALLIALIWWTSPGQLFQKIRGMGVGLILLIVLGGVSHLVKALAWRYSFSTEHRTLSLTRLFLVRLAGESVSQLTVAGVGETTRAWMVKSAVSTAGSVSAVIADRAMFTVSSLLVALVGMVLWISTPGSLSLSGIGALALLTVLLAPILLWILILRNRWPLLSRVVRRMARYWPGWEARLPVIREIEDNLYSLYHDDRLNFGRVLALNMAGQSLSLIEVFLVLTFLGIEADLILTIKIEAAVKCINVLGMIIPGNMGTSEAGNMFVLGSLGLGSSNGLALALARRLRAWFWTVIGLAILYFRTFVFDPVSTGGTGNRGTDSGTPKGGQ